MLLLFLFFALSTSTVVSEHSDMIEMNIVHDSKGSPILSQVVFWKWYREEQRYHVREWRMRDGLRIQRRGKNVSVCWYDQSHNCERCVVSTHYKESFTQHDTEREDAKTFHDRIGFIRPNLKQPIPDPLADEILPTVIPEVRQ